MELREEIIYEMFSVMTQGSWNLSVKLEEVIILTEVYIPYTNIRVIESVQLFNCQTSYALRKYVMFITYGSFSLLFGKCVDF